MPCGLLQNGLLHMAGRAAACMSALRLLARRPRGVECGCGTGLCVSEPKCIQVHASLDGDMREARFCVRVAVVAAPCNVLKNTVCIYPLPPCGGAVRRACAVWSGLWRRAAARRRNRGRHLRLARARIFFHARNAVPGDTAPRVVCTYAVDHWSTSWSVVDQWRCRLVLQVAVEACNMTQRLT